VHAKLIVVDNQHALVGSMNIDRSAFDLRRELGIMTDDPAIVGRLKEVFDTSLVMSRAGDLRVHQDQSPDRGPRCCGKPLTSSIVEVLR
jgi:phosphatidylserine/phosphatidylglycerophosphate/cardiolipin synthase-like enzyme